MIDIFNELYTAFVTALATYDASIETSSVYTNTPPDFPFVSFEEIDNSVNERGSDSCDIENLADVEYEVNIYTQNPNKKSKGDAIAQVVDTFMKTKGFRRVTKNSFQDSNETTYRIIMRYSGVVSKDSVIYRR